MHIITLILAAILSVFSTSVMSYIAMATPIGPWIAPTLVLLCILFFKIFMPKIAYQTPIALATVSGSIGGIIATAIGFSLPTLYFLDNNIFNAFMARPWYFSIFVSWLALAAGGFGFVIANILEQEFIYEQKMPFPIGQLIYKMIAVQHEVRKAWELAIGFISTIIFCALQNGISSLKGIIPKVYMLCSRVDIFFFPIPCITIRFDQLPMLWAIGFITGHVIAKPLAIGALTKIFLIDPMNGYFFPLLNNTDFLMAFCSGIVLSGAITSFIYLPKMLKNAFDTIKNGKQKTIFFKKAYHAVTIPEFIIMLCIAFGFFLFIDFSFSAQLFLLVSAFICTYQIVAIAGKIGLATLGRFATFVMVPFMLLFGINFVHITIVATFIEICGGVATDVLFGRKVGQLAHMKKNQLKYMQLFGLIISACSVGIVTWLLINHFGLGSEELVAQRAQGRALLINFGEFNYFVLIIGILFGQILKFFKVNPMLVLGGLLMSPSYVLVLVAGGLSTYLVQDRERWEPFWSGVFAANSIWVIIQAIFSI